jgi:hypothetical protein
LPFLLTAQLWRYSLSVVEAAAAAVLQVPLLEAHQVAVAAVAEFFGRLLL